jgi:cytochrome c oxidase assembly protein subunit 15
VAPTPGPGPIEPDGTRERFTISARAYQRVVVVALFFLSAIIVTGAAVRLTGSGMGCETWPNCEQGDFISTANPNQAIEQVNRLFTGVVGFAVIAAVLGSLRRRPYRRDLVGWSLGLVAGVIGQIVLGGITVLTHVHPLAVAGHFVLSQVLVTNAVILLWRSGQQPGPRRPLVPRADLNWSRLAVGLGSLLMITGPVVTGSGPHGGDEAAERFGFFIPDVVRVHSVNMWLFLAALLVVLVRVARHGAPAAVLRRGWRLLAAIVAQGAIGYTQYELGIPEGLVLLHIVGATVVVGLTVWFHLGLSAPTGGDGPATEDRPLHVGVPA